MCPSDEPRSLASAMKSWMDSLPNQKDLKKGMILSLFPKVAGKRLAEQVKKVAFRGDVLVLTVPDSTWKHEIHMQRYALCQKLNKEVEAEIIKEIVVR